MIASDDKEIMGRQPPTTKRALLLFAVGYNVTHHNGSLFSGLGSLGQTRVADWLDLLTPFAVVLPLVWLLAPLRADRRWWALFVVGAIVYVEGHGIHLSANSVSNVIQPDSDASDIVHLWDEVAGHYIWYGGLAIMLAAVIRTLHVRSEHIDLPIDRTVTGVVVAQLTGLTWATNSLEGGTAIFGLTLAFGALGYGITNRRGIAQLVVIAASVASLVLVVYGALNGGFPQPSER